MKQEPSGRQMSVLLEPQEDVGITVAAPPTNDRSPRSHPKSQPTCSAQGRRGLSIKRLGAPLMKEGTWVCKSN
jgi:hypothetical protein